MVNDGYSGDKYTKIIFDEAAKKFNKTASQIDKIWSEKYYLTYSTTNSYYSTYSKSYSSFSNKYGTASTICAHYGCSNYIASSGDTNCCVMHSNRCAECGCYVDEDASYCMDCINKVFNY